MDKEFIIKIVEEINSKSISVNNITTLLIDYCVVEHKKSIEDTNNFIRILTNSFNNRILLFNCIQTALNYYKRKFNMCELYSKEGNLLQIF